MRAAALPRLSRPAARKRAALRLLSPPAILLLVMAAMVAVVPPVGEFPIDDDWLYARVVQALLERGELQVPAWAGASLVLQAYWGALFAQLFGFSHTVLRVSTLVLSAAGVLGFYTLLAELLDRPRALLGALLLLCNPLYVFLSYSFLTNVPFLALALWALVGYVRALRGRSPHLGWLAAGSVLAGGAYLVRQLGLALPLAALGGLLLSGQGRAAFGPRQLLALLGPFLPAVLLGAYFDSQRGPIKEEPLGWTLDFWAEQGLGMAGVLLARLAETFLTLGLFTLPLSAAALLGHSRPRLDRRQRWLAAGLLLLLGAGYTLRSLDFGRSPLFPYIQNVLYRRGFRGDHFNDTFPQSIVLPDSVLLIVSLAAITGGALLALVVVDLLTRKRLGAATLVPLLFGLLVLGLTLVYYDFYDVYLLAVFPSVVLAALRTLPCCQWNRALPMAGVVLLAAWSIWWEQEYLERRAALWQAGQMLVAHGVPPEQIDGGLEWNGWYRGQAVIASAIQQAQADGARRRLATDVIDILYTKSRWAVAYAPPTAPAGRVLGIVRYGRGHRVFAVRNF